MKPKNTELEFSSCLEKSLKGDLQSMEKIMEMLTPLIKSSIKKYFLGDLSMEDLLQEGYLKIIECIKTFDETKGIPFLGYIKPSLRFMYMDLGRKTIKEEHESLNKPLNSENDNIELLDLIEDDAASTEMKLIDIEELNFLNNILTNLSNRELQVIKLCYYENKNMLEISEQLGISYRTVVNTKVNAIKKLRSYY